MGIWGFSGVPVKIFIMVDCRTRLLEHSGKCVGYVTLSLTESHTSAPSIRPLLSTYAFTTLRGEPKIDALLQTSI